VNKKGAFIKMEKFLSRFEHFIVIVLLGMMVVVVSLATIELGIIIYQQMKSPPLYMLLDLGDLLKIFGFFFMILIGLELIETIKVYLSKEVIPVEIIFLVAIIAVTRKVIILDFKNLDPITLIGMAAIIIALSVGYYVVKKVLDHD
jgi:uncharacterized membrane protein (DUF373 family)